MTELTAKKGMVRYKTGHGSKDFDYGYLDEINYDDKRKLKQVIETLFTDNKRLVKELDNYKIATNEKLQEMQNKMDKFVKTLGGKLL